MVMASGSYEIWAKQINATVSVPHGNLRGLFPSLPWERHF